MATTRVSRYGKVFQLGHRQTKGLLDEPCVVEEKIDGSQFSFSVDGDGSLIMRSKNAQIVHNVPDLFTKTVATVESLHERGLLTPGVVYRGEAMKSHRHNTLAYDRAPKGNFVLFDVDVGGQDYLSYELKAAIAEALGVEVVPLVYRGIVTKEVVAAALDRESMLGGVKVEGVVIKRDTVPIFDPGGLPVKAKFVSEAFKEKHTKNPDYRPKKKLDVVAEVVESVSTEARWLKAVQHMREEDVLTDSPKDIGPLIKRVQQDIVAEEIDWIKSFLWNHYKKLVMRRACAGVALWYKQYLLDNTWDDDE